MTFQADLSPCTYFGAWDVPLIAVGWLHPSHPHSRGRASTELVSALVRLLVDPWQPFVLAGRHACELCVGSVAPWRVRIHDTDLDVGHLNLFVPGDVGIFVTPSMIVHYIDAHEYAPPAEFEQAVLACPEMHSELYLDALDQHGGMRLTRPPR